MNLATENASVYFDSSFGTSSPTPKVPIFIDDTFSLTGLRSFNTHFMVTQLKVGIFKIKVLIVELVEREPHNIEEAFTSIE